MENQITETNSIESTTDMVLDFKAMEQMNNLAILMAGGKTTVPKHLQDSPADCMAIVMQAAQWKMNPYAVAQKTHLVNGTLGYEAQLVNAVISSSRAIKGRFHYEYGGNWPNGADAWVRVGAVLSGEEGIQWGEPLYPALVTTKNSPLWKTAPKQQASYLAVKYWARLFAPAVILGVYSSDELEPAKQTERVINNNVSTQSSTLNSILSSDNDPEKVGLFNDFSVALKDCQSIEELNEVGQKIHDAFESDQLKENERQILQAEYSQQKKQLTPIEAEAS